MASGAPDRVLVLGEALMDVVVNDTGTVEHPGGSPMNVSLGIARLGIPVSFGTALGDDDRGRSIVRHLAGVEILPGPISGQRTSSAEVTLDAAGAPEYRFDVQWALERSAVAHVDPSHVHFGSISAYLEPGARDVRAIVARLAPTATVSFDPNIRPQFLRDRSWALAATEGHIAASDVVKASDEDVAWLYPGSSIDDVARQWLMMGPSLVVVTRGGDGATLFGAAGELTAPARTVTVVDSIGAGDAFMSGLIAGLHSRGLVGVSGRARLRELPAAIGFEVLDLATDCGGLTVARAGAQPPRLDELRSGLL